MQSPPFRLHVNVSASFTAEPVEPALTWWLERLGWTPQLEFAPFNQVFQQLLDPTTTFARQRDSVNVTLVRLEDWTRRGLSPARADASESADAPTFVLPNGFAISQLNRYETEYVYQEIFTDRVYLKHGITIEDDDCVVDIGANIGLFSLFVAQHAPAARTFACEPSPIAFGALQQNLSRYAPFATALNCGVGDDNRQTSFTAYERSSVFSSFHADADEDRDAIRAVVKNVLREQAGVATEALESLTDTLVADRLESRVVDVQMRTLSSLISEHGVDRIDLLKIDAEKSELQILRGIESQHWSRIRQIVIEVHDTTGKVLPEVRAILEAHDFDLTAVEEESLLEDSGLFNVYAIRRGGARAVEERFDTSTAQLKKTAIEFAGALRASSARTAAPHIAVFCPMSSNARSEAKWSDLYREVEQQIADELAGTPGVQLVTSAMLEALYPEAASHDVRAESLGAIPYTPLGFAAIGAQVARRIYAALRPAAKVIVVDCDQTLWQGVVGEDGPSGVRLAPAHLALQRYLVAQHAHGRLICLCSKNDEDDVLATFRSRADFPLTLDHITSWRINWEKKSANIQALAAELDLGLDSFVFIDDNPAECAEVHGLCPEVVTLQLPSNAALVERLLLHLWPCDPRQSVTEEDQQRTVMYRQGAERSRWREQAVSFEAFIEGLELRLEIEPLTHAAMSRASQLTERTNQFNFTTIRRSEAQLRALIDQRQLEFLTVRVSDRFGDYGLAGLVGFSIVEDRLRIDTFLLSCRVLGKGVEHRIVAELGALAVQRSLTGLDLRFVATKRNTPALQFATSLDQCTSLTTPDGVLFSLDALSAASVRFDPSRNLAEPFEEARGSQSVEPLTDPAFLACIPESWSQAGRVLAELGRRGESSRTVAAPRTAAEEALVRIWRECLGLTPGVDENYFDLGGDSIRAVQIASRAHAEGLRISPKDILDRQTIAALAATISEAGPTAPPTVTRESTEGRLDESTRRALQAISPPPSAAYRLTPMQTMFYVQYSAGLDVGFEQWQFTLEGSLSVPRYRAAWEQVITHHDALRTAFHSKGLAHPCQVVLPEAVLPWHEESLESCSAAEQLRRIQDYVAADRARRFTLTDAPLMRLAVFALGGSRWRVVWTFHHLVIDGWSCPIVLGHVAAAYATGEKPTTAVPQFQRLVEWQAAAAVDRDKTYWRNVLSGLSGPTPLPLGDRQQATQASGGEWFTTIPTDRVTEMLARARTLRVTLGTLFQVAWALVVARMSEREDVVFGLTMSGRPPAIRGVERIVGTFVNNVPIRVSVSREQALTSMLPAIQQRVNEAAEHQFLAPAEIQKVSAVPMRDRLFDSLLIVQNYVGAGDTPVALGPGTLITALEAPIRTGYPVTVVVTPGKELRVALVVRDRPWSDRMGQEVLNAFVGLATAVADGHERTVDDVFATLEYLPRAGGRVWGIESGDAFAPPRTPLESEIAEVWQSAFGHQRFGVDSNFFDLGGHSLLMLQVHDALQTRLKRTLSIVDLFEHPTIAALAKQLTGGIQDVRLRAAKSRAQLQREAMGRHHRRGGAA